MTGKKKADQRLGEAMLDLASSSPSTLTRVEWVKKFSQLRSKSMEIERPENHRALKVNWGLCRIGGIWDRDEEHHVYCMADAIRLFVETRAERPDATTVVVTPIWVFLRSGDGIVASQNVDVRRRAEKNFMRFLVGAVQQGGIDV